MKQTIPHAQTTLGAMAQGILSSPMLEHWKIAATDVIDDKNKTTSNVQESTLTHWPVHWKRGALFVPALTMPFALHAIALLELPSMKPLNKSHSLHKV